MTFGLWAAQEAFDTACSGGLNVNQYCNSAAEKCCGLCNVVPISGPGSILSNLLSTFLNLCFALHFKSETPYTLFFQLFSMDFVVFSLIDRALQTKNRISLFHYSWVPLTASSIVPITVACCLSRLKYMHGLSSSAEIAISRGMFPPETPERSPSPEDDRAGHSGLRLRTGARRSTQHALAHRRKATPMPEDWSSKKRPGLQRRPSLRSTQSIDPSRYGATQKKLARVVLWATICHLVFYAATFVGVYGFVSNTWQASCIEEYGLQQWRIGMACLAAVLLLTGCIFWFCLYFAMSEQFRHDKKLIDGLEVFIAGLAAVLHLTSLRAWVLCRDDWRKMKKRKNALRWGISIAVYLMWAIPYAFLYVKAGNDFLLPGLNPWPFEQVAAAVSVLTPICIVARSYVNEKDGYAGKQKALEDARIVKQYGHSFRAAPPPATSDDGDEHVMSGGAGGIPAGGDSSSPPRHGRSGVHESPLPSPPAQRSEIRRPLRHRRPSEDSARPPSVWLESDIPRHGGILGHHPSDTQSREAREYEPASPLDGDGRAARYSSQPQDAVYASERVPAREFQFPSHTGRAHHGPHSPPREVGDSTEGHPRYAPTPRSKERARRV